MPQPGSLSQKSLSQPAARCPVDAATSPVALAPARRAPFHLARPPLTLGLAPRPEPNAQIGLFSDRVCEFRRGDSSIAAPHSPPIAAPLSCAVRKMPEGVPHLPEAAGVVSDGPEAFDKVKSITCRVLPGWSDLSKDEIEVRAAGEEGAVVVGASRAGARGGRGRGVLLATRRLTQRRPERGEAASGGGRPWPAVDAVACVSTGTKWRRVLFVFPGALGASMFSRPVFSPFPVSFPPRAGFGASWWYQQCAVQSVSAECFVSDACRVSRVRQRHGDVHRPRV